MKNISKFILFLFILGNSGFNFVINPVKAEDSSSSPVITSISPTSGEAPISNPIGTKVTIYGEHLGDNCKSRGRGCNMFVGFGDEIVNFQTNITTDATWTDTKIEVEVPTGATTAAIRVGRSETENYGWDNAKLISSYDITGPVFTVTNAHYADSITPDRGMVGTVVTIKGRNFGADCRSDGESCILEVYFGDLARVGGFSDFMKSWSDTEIVVEVLNFATTGSTRIVRSHSSGSFDIQGPYFIVESGLSPEIHSITPTSGPTDTEVTIMGQGFKDPCSGKGTLTCQAVVFFGDAAVNFVNDTFYHISWTDDKIVTRVPSHATTGTVRVYRNEIFNWGEEGSYNETFDVTGPVFTVTNNVKKVDTHIEEIKKTTEYVSDSKYDALLQEINTLRDQVKEQAAEIKYLKSLTSEFKNVTENMKTFMTNFVAYGVDENTKKLGEGERAAVLNSYKEAYGKLPETNIEIEDTIKIANGRFPSLRNESIEEEAEKIFEHVYGRKPDTENASDQNFTMVVSYGLRQKTENRKLETEKRAIEIYKGIYNELPKTTDDWNILQGIAYSGAKR